MISTRFKLILIWIVAGSTAYMMASYPINSVLINNEFVPFAPDSFYHARRILFLLNNGVFLQFDPNVNAPYGEFVSWPWAYDTFLAFVVFFVYKINSDLSYISILVNIPPLWVYLNAALIIAIAQSLRLSVAYTILAAACFALSPLTHQLHTIGRIDHHMAEYTFVLGSIWLGILWLRNHKSRQLAFSFGLLLGISTSFHNGLFILQLPILFTFFILWLNKKKLPETIPIFSGSLILSTLITLLPSDTFRLWFFTFYYHSWFHLYIACCTSIMLYLFLVRPFSLKNSFLIIFIATLLSVPVLFVANHGMQFIVGDSKYFYDINEMISPVSWKDSTSIFPSVLIVEYSGLLLLLPVSVLILIGWLFDSREMYRWYFVTFSIMGSILLLSQYRFNYFGTFVLYFPILIIGMSISERLVKYKFTVFAFLSIGLAICYYPSFSQYFITRPLGGSDEYYFTHSVYSDFKKSCEENPGVVLADYNDVHYVTFHTKCSVVSNNMRITPLDFERVHETQRLLDLPVNEIIEKEKWIDYIFVTRLDPIISSMSKNEIEIVNKKLRTELLLNDEHPDGLTLMSSVTYNDIKGEIRPFAKVFKINH